MIRKPPYEVSEAGYGRFTLSVEIHFRNIKEEPRKYRIVGMRLLNITKVEALTFLNPSDDFEKKLLRGGAVVLGALSR